MSAIAGLESAVHEGRAEVREFVDDVQPVLARLGIERGRDDDPLDQVGHQRLVAFGLAAADGRGAPRRRSG